jgi:FAD/FMN-containing dehydrogenase
MRRESFNLLRKRIKNKRTAPFIDDVIVEPEKLPEFLPKLNAILKPYEDRMTYTIAGHVGNGNFHIIPLMDFHAMKLQELIHTVSDQVYDLTVSMGGSVTAEHNDGLIRSPYLEKMYGKEIISLFEQTKQMFDPLTIFNPGKKVRSSLEYALRHVAHR